MNNIKNTASQEIYWKYIKHLGKYMSFDEGYRIGRDFGDFPDTRFMREFEEPIIPVIEVQYTTNGHEGPYSCRKSVPTNFHISDKARIFILNLIRSCTSVVDNGMGIGFGFTERWNDIKVIEQCVDAYLKKHPELLKVNRSITDDWEQSKS